MGMKQYVVSGQFVTLHAGTVKLTREQADKRHYALRPKKKDTYTIVQPVQFKRGETFGYDGDVPKHMADDLAEAKKAQESGDKNTAKPKTPESLAALNVTLEPCGDGYILAMYNGEDQDAFADSRMEWHTEPPTEQPFESVEAAEQAVKAWLESGQ